MNLKDINTRAVLAYFWSLATALFIGYILVRFGQEKEILTLIIGLIGGTIIGGIFGVYFGGANSKHPTTDNNSSGENIETGDTVTVTKE